MKTVTALILAVILAGCGGGDIEPKPPVVIGEADRACRDASGIEVPCK